MPGSAGFATAFVFQEPTLPDLPAEPISIPSDESLTREFLIRQSSLLSGEAASRLLIFVVSAIDEAVEEFTNAKNELANLYELSAQYSLNHVGEDRMLQLRKTISDKKKEMSDLEMLFQYTRKLMDANAEVSFLVKEDFASKQTSEQIHSATRHVEEKLEAVQLAELDLTRAHTMHIEKLTKNLERAEEKEDMEYQENSVSQ